MQHSDITLPIDNGTINIRVGAIIMKDGKFLMTGNPRVDYLYSVGGRIKFGESAEEAVVREVLEETGTQMEIDHLGFVHENFFYGESWDVAARADRLIYEISLFFYMKVPEDFEPVCGSETDRGDAELLVWVSPDDKETKYFPEFFRTELAHPSENVKHFVTDERKDPPLYFPHFQDQQ